jgi:hypothetical protein
MFDIFLYYKLIRYNFFSHHLNRNFVSQNNYYLDKLENKVVFYNLKKIFFNFTYLNYFLNNVIFLYKTKYAFVISGRKTSKYFNDTIDFNDEKYTFPFLRLWYSSIFTHAKNNCNNWPISNPLVVESEVFQPNVFFNISLKDNTVLPSEYKYKLQNDYKIRKLCRILISNIGLSDTMHKSDLSLILNSSSINTIIILLEYYSILIDFYFKFIDKNKNLNIIRKHFVVKKFLFVTKKKIGLKVFYENNYIITTFCIFFNLIVKNKLFLIRKFFSKKKKLFFHENWLKLFKFLKIIKFNNYNSLNNSEIPLLFYELIFNTMGDNTTNDNDITYTTDISFITYDKKYKYYSTKFKRVIKKIRQHFKRLFFILENRIVPTIFIKKKKTEFEKRNYANLIFLKNKFKFFKRKFKNIKNKKKIIKYEEKKKNNHFYKINVKHELNKKNNTLNVHKNKPSLNLKLNAKNSPYNEKTKK